jgi:hypothetical protein
MACRILMISFALLCACSSDETGDAESTDGAQGSGASGSSTTGASGTPASSGATSGSGAAGGGGGAAAGGGMGAVGGAGSGGAVEPANDCEACFFESCAAQWTECQADPSGYCTIFLPTYYQCADQQGDGCCEAYQSAGPPAVAMVECWTAECASECPCE